MLLLLYCFGPNRKSIFAIMISTIHVCHVVLPREFADSPVVISASSIGSD